MSDLPHNSISRQLQDARNGNPRELGRLLERFRPMLNDRANHLLGTTIRTKESASDVVQNSLLHAVTGFSEFRGKTESEFRDWLASILEHRAIDLARRYRCGKRNVDREDSLQQEMVDSQSTPLSRMASQELLERLIGELCSLSQDERRIIHLRYAESASFDDIAAQIGASRETVRRTWYRLIERLGKRLETPRE